MKECFKCGVSEERARLSDVISNRGIVHVCSRCIHDEDLPVIRKPRDFTESEREGAVHRLSSVFGVQSKQSKSSELKGREVTLRDIVERNLMLVVPEQQRQNEDLVENFHWVLMRARRLKHITHEQLAKEVGESEQVIKMAEKGVLPDDNYKLISKLEGCLGVKLFKEEVVEEMERQPKVLGFDSVTSKTLTISDLQGMKQKREEKIFEKSKGLEEDSLDEDSVFNEEASEDEPEFNGRSVEDNEEYGGLSKEEIDKIIFGK